MRCSLEHSQRRCDDSLILYEPVWYILFCFSRFLFFVGGKWPFQINSRFICRIYHRCRYNKYEYLLVKNFRNSFSYSAITTRMCLVCVMWISINNLFRLQRQRKTLWRRREDKSGSVRGREIIARISLCLALVLLHSTHDAPPAYYHHQTEHNFLDILIFIPDLFCQRIWFEASMWCRFSTVDKLRKFRGIIRGMDDIFRASMFFYFQISGSAGNVRACTWLCMHTIRKSLKWPRHWIIYSLAIFARAYKM